jgi:hypothetical protein
MDTAKIEISLTLTGNLHSGRKMERLRPPQPQASRLIAFTERKLNGKRFGQTSRQDRRVYARPDPGAHP